MAHRPPSASPLPTAEPAAQPQSSRLSTIDVQYGLGLRFAEGRGVVQDDAESAFCTRPASVSRPTMRRRCSGTAPRRCSTTRKPVSTSPGCTPQAAPPATAAVPADLTDLIGIASVRAEVDSLTRFIHVQHSRRQVGLKTPPLSLHLVFTVNPGTGKTTVARRIGAIYQRLGLLHKGHVVECRRQDLIGQYVGQIAPRVQQKCREALDGVLFIDEAYESASSLP